MPITKATGNMYDWITHTHSHLRGACPHACPYCYVQAIDARFNSTHHQGPVHIAEAELKADYRSPRVLREAAEKGHKNPVIFIEHTGDLFAEDIPVEFISAILQHIQKGPDNTYVFQTKNPERMRRLRDFLPYKSIVGVTIESDITHVGKTPSPKDRGLAFFHIPLIFPAFITVEPVLKFSPAFADYLISLHPAWINLGADSKHTPGLPEPTADELLDLIHRLQSAKIEIRSKRNLARLLTPNS